MLYKLIPAVVIVMAIALLFSHPSPFREPEYLANRSRILQEAKERKNGLWLQADFNSDGVTDSAYCTISNAAPDSGMVFVRFNHFVPSIELDYEYGGISHIETVNDINGNGAAEIYFIAIKRGGCDATGFLYQLENRQWKKAASIEQEGCRKFYEYNHEVEVLYSGRFRISYYKKQSSHPDYYEGRIF